MVAVAPLSLALVIVSAQFPPPGGPGPACLFGPELRDAVRSREVVPPFRAVGEAMHEGGDLLGIRLCRSPNPPLVYDVTVLRRDGRLVHVIIDGASGTALPGRRQP